MAGQLVNGRFNSLVRRTDLVKGAQTAHERARVHSVR